MSEPAAPQPPVPNSTAGAPVPPPVTPGPTAGATARPTVAPAAATAPGSAPGIQQAEPPREPGLTKSGKAKRTRVSGVWIGLIAATVVLVLLIIFIAQNTRSVSIHYLGFNGNVSVGLALLIAAICGVVIALVPGTIRIAQLRKSVRRLGREHRAEARELAEARSHSAS